MRPEGTASIKEVEIYVFFLYYSIERIFHVFPCQRLLVGIAASTSERSVYDELASLAARD